jgi:hypothetical protein
MGTVSTITKCNAKKTKLPVGNFTFNTSKEHQLHIPSQKLFFDSYQGNDLKKCYLSLMLVYDPKF